MCRGSRTGIAEPDHAAIAAGYKVTSRYRVFRTGGDQGEFADNFMMHMIVEDVEDWWSHVQAQGLIAKYGVRAEPPADRPWGLRDFVIFDPTGVFWRMGQDIEPNKA
jgi:hypothetical protein